MTTRIILGEIREAFLEEVKKLENKDKLQQPAIFFIVEGMRDQMCHAKERETTTNKEKSHKNQD